MLQARSRLDYSVIESIDLTEEEIQIIEEENQVEAELERQHAAIRRQARNRPAIPLRNPPLGPTFTLKEIESYPWKGSKLRKGKTVELKNGSFLYIDKVFDSDDDVIMIGGLEDSTVRLRGRILKRHRDILGYLAHQRNELCFVYEVDLDDKRPITEQCVVEVGLNDIKKIRKLIITNQPYPVGKYDRNRLPLPHPNTLQYKLANDQYIEDYEVLTCRWKSITYFETAAARIFPKSKASIHHPHCRVESVTEQESSVTYDISAESRRHIWRGDTALGGSYFNRGESQYTYGDCCK
jgi:DNA (cytosine-5)-methyltransferase 1